MDSYVPPPSSQPPSMGADATHPFQLRMSHPRGNGAAPVPHHHTPLTPVSLLLRAALIVPNKRAVVYPERNLCFTYAQFAARVLSLTLAVREALRTGSSGASGGGGGGASLERVAVIAPNGTMILEALNAVPAAGGIVNPLNIRNHPNEIAYIIDHSQPRLILCDHEFLHLVPKQLPRGCRLVVGHDTGRLEPLPGGRDGAVDEYEHFLQSGRDVWTRLQAESAARGEALRDWQLVELPRDEQQGGFLCYTSGTTGKPKGVLTSHRGTYLAALANAFEMRMDPESVMLWTLPLFHAAGWTQPFSVHAAFATHHVIRKVDYDVIWDALLRHGATHYAGAPTVQLSIVNHPRAQRLPRAVRVAVAASAPTAHLLASMERLNLVPTHVYGLTETYGPVARRYADPSWASLPVEERAKLMARQGHGFLTSEEMRVVEKRAESFDASDPSQLARDAPRDVAWDGRTVGEIACSGNLVMLGYYRDAAATRRSFTADGWFRTGDLAVREPGGEVRILDRAKDIFISGGENVSSLAVESELATHPAVLECCVVGRKDAKWAEVGHAFVILRQGRRGAADDEARMAEELREHCRARMSKFAVPAHWSFVEELPKTSTGKIQKNVLRERVAKL